jgi:hypothetical protein
MAKKEIKIEDIKLPQVEVLKENDTKGLPEAGASLGLAACCSVAIA